MQIIINWLGGQQNFTVGTTLYQTFGTDEAFMQMLLQGETLAARKQLAEALRKLVEPVEVNQPSATIIAPPSTAIVEPETSEMPPSDDDVLQAIRNEWLPLYQRMNVLRHNLDRFGSKNSRKAIEFREPIASEIKQLEKQINAIWAKRDFYEKEGKLPFVTSKKIEIPTDPMKHAMLINNIAKSIRTNRKLMKDRPGNPKYAQLYNDYKEKYKSVTGKDYEEKV